MQTLVVTDTAPLGSTEHPPSSTPHQRGNGHHLTSLTLRGLKSPCALGDVMFGDGGLRWEEGVTDCEVCVYLALEREEEDKGDPICLFCPPDVSESRLRGLAQGGWGPPQLHRLQPFT